MRLVKTLVISLGGLSAAMMLTPTFGSGFALNEQSASGLGNAFAGGAAIAEDATTVYFNPAGMSRISGDELAVGANLIMIKAAFSNNGSINATDDQPLSGRNDTSKVDDFVPNVYYVTDFAKASGWKFGVGLNVPFGLRTDYEDDWIGRYHAVHSDLKTLNVNPSASYEFSDKLAVGAGVSIQYLEVELTSAVDFAGICSAQLPVSTCRSQITSDGFASVTGKSWAYGWNLGMLYTMSETTRFGMAYRSQLKHDIDGNVDFTVPGGAQFLTSTGYFRDTAAEASVTLPASASISAYHEYNDKVAVMTDLSWTNWRVFDELRIQYPDSPQPDSVTTEEWDDTLKLAFGLNYTLNPQMLIRTGIAYEQTPIPNAERRTARIPGNDRRWVAIGMGFKPLKNLAFDIAYAHLFTSKTDINNTYESTVPTIQHTLRGSYDSAVDILSLQFRMKI